MSNKYGHQDEQTNPTFDSDLIRICILCHDYPKFHKEACEVLNVTYSYKKEGMSIYYAVIGYLVTERGRPLHRLAGSEPFSIGILDMLTPVKIFEGNLGFSENISGLKVDNGKAKLFKGTPMVGKYFPPTLPTKDFKTGKEVGEIKDTEREFLADIIHKEKARMEQWNRIIKRWNTFDDAQAEAALLKIAALRHMSYDVASGDVIIPTFGMVYTVKPKFGGKVVTNE